MKQRLITQIYAADVLLDALAEEQVLIVTDRNDGNPITISVSEEEAIPIREARKTLLRIIKEYSRAMPPRKRAGDTED